MRNHQKVVLVVNLIFLVFNVWLFFKVLGFNNRCQERINASEAKQVIHEFINNTRQSIDEYSFDVDKEHVEFNRHDLSLPYDIHRVIPEGILGYDLWGIHIKFQNDREYYAEALRQDSGKWRLESFGIVLPTNVPTIQAILRIYVKAAHKYMTEHSVTSVDYNTIVKEQLVRPELLAGNGSGDSVSDFTAVRLTVQRLDATHSEIKAYGKKCS